ncbi:hypothetical protein Bpfe_023463 [Biomphalaria pfeifferi]|uniref:Uncharacterized protein n=1 Tax=Biomphalaria pfeifferi TaxID=112525 RepID=A0AAD8F0S7_BIOPF|nr:hypothetical protein Bpfe_023463 [Biomphalaria pfeifferi]
MNMRMPRGGLTPVVVADRSWDFSLECLQFLAEGDEGFTLNGNVWRAAEVCLQATKHASPGVGGYDMRHERNLNY